MRIARRPRQRDAHLEVARAGTGAVPARHQMLGERGALDQ